MSLHPPELAGETSREPDASAAQANPFARGPRPEIVQRSIDPARVDADAAKVIRRLVREGHTAFLVGGGVRDLLLGRSPKDFDVATSARPNEVRAVFRNCRVIGRRFRLAHVMFGGGKIIEVATFRRDPDLGEGVDDVDDRDDAPDDAALDATAHFRRKRELGATQDLLIRHDNVFGEPHEDALRRDFTINGLFFDIDRNEVIDFVGGMRDLDARMVRTIGDPDVRFREDPVRILRAIKFSARCDLGIHPDVYDAMIAHRSEIARSAPPRIVEEVLRLLRGGAAQRSLFLTWDTGVLPVIAPELAALLDDDAPDASLFWRRLREIDRRVSAGEAPSDAVMLAALLRGPIFEAMQSARDPAAAFDAFLDHVVRRLAIPRRMKDRMRSIFAVQRRLRAGKIAGMQERDFFRDAAAYFGIDLASRGEPEPDWMREPLPEPDPGSDAGRERRRPRRGRRRRY